MDQKDFTRTFYFSQTPAQVFHAINNVRAWWSEDFTGNSEKLHEAFEVRFGTVHYSRQEIVELLPEHKIVWLVTDSELSFLKNKQEWDQTRVVFDITSVDGQTKLVFTHQGLVPSIECFKDCSNGWTQYLQHSLIPYIKTGKGDPNVLQPEIHEKTKRTTQQVADRFRELALQENWFGIQDELFADNVKSIDPPHSPYFEYAEGKAAVRRKGEAFVSRIEAGHDRYTSDLIVAANHFAAQRRVDITVKGFGRIQIDQIMLYEVKDGKIIAEQFFY